MTNSYLIHAWCLRPFITTLDPVEAATPQEAIATARRLSPQMLDAAEECNDRYPWDEFAVYDQRGNRLLHMLDDDARLRDAAPKLLEALQHCIPIIEENCPDDNYDPFYSPEAEALAIARAAVAQALPASLDLQP